VNLSEPNCPSNWTLISGNCYFKGPIEMNWTDSKTFCENEGSSLITIQNQKEFDLLRNISAIFQLDVFHVKKFKKSILKTQIIHFNKQNSKIGLRTISKPANFSWLDGRALSTASPWLYLFFNTLSDIGFYKKFFSLMSGGLIINLTTIPLEIVRSFLLNSYLFKY
jgi:hypothetical protein